jgi:hypothetical protein
MNTVKTLLKDIKKAKAVYGYVAYNKHDGEYLQLVKKDALAIFIRMSENEPVHYKFDNEFLYIN